MIEPLTADEEAALSQYHLGGPEQPSLLGRIGQQAANVPSDIFNDLSRLAFNVGIRSPDQTQAPEVAKPFDIAPPETTGQSVVDIGASLVRALPLILAGETAGAGVAELAGAAPTAAKIIGSAVGFGAQGLTESPEQAALQTSIGAGFRAADFLPLRYKLPLAGAIGALTGAESYAQDPNIEKAAGVGLINAALPFILKGRERGELATDRAEVPNAGQPMPAIYTERGGGPLTEIPSTVQPQGDLINPNRVTSSPRPRPVATLQSDFFPELFTPQETQPFLPFGAPEGSLIREPRFSPVEAKRIAGVQPPEGSLIREPSITPAEAESFLRGFKQQAGPKGFRLSGEPELDLTTGIKDIRPDIVPGATNGQKLLFAPEGSLIRDISVTPAEVDRALEARRAQTQPNLLAPASVKPEQSYIVGPALINDKGEIIAQGKIGESHKTLFEGGIAANNFDEVLDAFSKDANHVFVDNKGNILNRTEAAKVASAAGQAPEGVATLHSQDLRNPEPAATPKVQPITDSTKTDLTAKKEKLPPLSLEGAPPSARPEGFRKAVRYKGKIYEGETHETAIEKIAKKFPRYRTESRKEFPLERGYITPEGKFESNLLNIARAAEKPKAAPIVEKPVATLQSERDILRKKIAAAGETQRGYPEATMMEAVRKIGEAGGPAILTHNLEHIGDLAHRASRENAIGNVAEKIRNILKRIRPTKGSLSFEEEMIQSYRDNAIYRALKENPELSAKYEQGGEARRAAWKEAAQLPEVGLNIANAKAVVKKYLQKYVDAHLEHNQPITKLGQLGKDAAVALGQLNIPKLRSTLEEINTWLKDYNQLGEEAQFAKFSEPIATLQPQTQPAKITTKVTGNKVTIGDSVYQLRKQGSTWYYEDQPLAKTKQGAVQQIKQLHAASVSPSPSLEKAQQDLALAADGRYQAGDKVLVDFDGEWEAGTIQTPNHETDIHQVRLPSGDVVDVRGSKIRAMTEQGKFEATTEGEVKQIGTLEDFRKLEKENAAKRIGLKMRRPIGEAGAIPVDVAVAMSRYVAAPIAGAIAGAALSDEDHRLSGAIKGAIFLGLAATYGPRIFRYLAEGHPNKLGAYPKAVKETASALKETIRDPHKAVVRARIEGKSSNFDKIALWFSHHLSTDINMTRLLMRSHGQIEVLGAAIHKSLGSLIRDDIDANSKQIITDYIEGKLPQKAFEFKLNNQELAQAVTTSRQALDSIINIVSEGTQDGKLKEAVADSFGKYLTTSYRIFTDDKYFPTDEQILRVANENKDGRIDLATKIKITTQELKDLKANRSLYGKRTGESISRLLFRKEDLSEAYKDALGIYKDPIERLIVTTSKLTQLGRSTAFFNEVAESKTPEGLRFAYYKEAYSKTLATLRQMSASAALAGDETKVATLQNQIEKLNDYVWNPPNEAHGRLGGQFLMRRVHDALAQRDSLVEESNTRVGRYLRNATTLFKYNKTVLSPLQFARQVMNVPLLGLMSRTGPGDWAKAFKSLRNPEERKALTRIGVVGGDIVGGLLRNDFDAVMKEHLDRLSFTNPIVKGLHNIEEYWRTPDLVVRVAAFQRQYAKALAEIPDGLDKAAYAIARQKAEDSAIDFMNRYTMNYEVIPSGVRIFSNVPFVNQFLTWAFELTRVTKNMAEDAIKKKDPYAIATLAGLASAPFALQRASESMLSTKDQKDWEKVKGLLPDYARGNFVWVTHRDAKGHFHYINFTGLLIHDSYLKMFRDVLQGDKKALLADNPIFGWENTPLLNIATNQISGEDIHTGQKLNNWLDRLDSVRRDFAPPILGTDLDKFVLAVTPNAEGGIGLQDIRTGQSTSIGGMLLSYLTATRAYTTDLTALQRRAFYAAKADIEDNRAQLAKILHSNARQDIKDRATEQFKFTSKQIMMELLRQTRPDLSQ